MLLRTQNGDDRLLGQPLITSYGSALNMHPTYVLCRFTKSRCHVRLPWLQCQMLPPAEAPILKEVRSTWQRSQHQALPAAARLAGPRQPGRPSPPAMPGGRPSSHEATPQQAMAGGAAPSTAAGAAALSGLPSTASEGQGPLLLFPDTSALMAMLAPRQGMALPTSFTLERFEVGGKTLRIVGWRQQSLATATAHARVTVEDASVPCWSSRWVSQCIQRPAAMTEHHSVVWPSTGHQSGVRYIPLEEINNAAASPSAGLCKLLPWQTCN